MNIDKKLDEILNEHFYLGEHTQCDDSCSNKWYEEDNIKQAKQEIKQLFQELIDEVIDNNRFVPIELFEKERQRLKKEQRQKAKELLEKL